MTHPIIKTDNYILITSDEEKKHEIKILSLWCGVGDSSPIDRCRELAEENNRLKLRISELVQQNKKDNLCMK